MSSPNKPASGPSKRINTLHDGDFIDLTDEIEPQSATKTVAPPKPPDKIVTPPPKVLTKVASPPQEAKKICGKTAKVISPKKGISYKMILPKPLSNVVDLTEEQEASPSTSVASLPKIRVRIFPQSDPGTKTSPIEKGTKSQATDVTRVNQLEESTVISPPLRPMAKPATDVRPGQLGKQPVNKSVSVPPNQKRLLTVTGIVNNTNIPSQVQQKVLYDALDKASSGLPIQSEQRAVLNPVLEEPYTRILSIDQIFKNASDCGEKNKSNANVTVLTYKKITPKNLTVENKDMLGGIKFVKTDTQTGSIQTVKQPVLAQTESSVDAIVIKNVRSLTEDNLQNSRTVTPQSSLKKSKSKNDAELTGLAMDPRNHDPLSVPKKVIPESTNFENFLEKTSTVKIFTTNPQITQNNKNLVFLVYPKEENPPGVQSDPLRPPNKCKKIYTIMSDPPPPGIVTPVDITKIINQGLKINKSRCRLYEKLPEDESYFKGYPDSQRRSSCVRLLANLLKQEETAIDRLQEQMKRKYGKYFLPWEKPRPEQKIIKTQGQDKDITDAISKVNEEVLQVKIASRDPKTEEALKLIRKGLEMIQNATKEKMQKTVGSEPGTKSAPPEPNPSTAAGSVKKKVNEVGTLKGKNKVDTVMGPPKTPLVKKRRGPRGSPKVANSVGNDQVVKKRRSDKDDGDDLLLIKKVCIVHNDGRKVGRKRKLP